MRHHGALSRRDLVLGGAFSMASGTQAAVPIRPDLVGAWTGALRSGNLTLRLRLTIGSDGSAGLLSLDEGGEARRASKVLLDNDRVHIRFAPIFASFKGRLVNGRLVGRWRQLFNDLPLALERTAG